MARFTPSSPNDLKMLAAGLCPECGASVVAGMTACGACRVEYGEHAKVLPSPLPPAKPLTDDDILELERGVIARSLFPISDAAGPDEFRPLALGAALSAALSVMADAALVDDPLVLMGWQPPPIHVPRLLLDQGRSTAASVDDPATFPPPVAPKGPPTLSLAPTQPDVDPEDTLVHDVQAIARVVAIAARGRAQALDD